MNPPPHILIVDDSAEDVLMTLTALKKQNLPSEAVVASDGAEALDYLYRRGEFQNRPGIQPRAVLLDLKMPRVDGMEVLRQMKSDSELKMIPVVMFTSSREASDVLKCYQLGVNAYVVKPVNLREFMEAIKEVSVFWIVINEPPPLQPAAPKSICPAPVTDTALSAAA